LTAELHKPELSTRAPQPGDEAATLEALVRDQIHHGEPDQLVGDFIRLAAEVCSAPVAVLSVVRSDSVHHISRFGSSSDNTYNTAGEDALVSRAILERELYVVPDTLKDRRFKDDVPATERGAVRFYAGAPFLTSEGSVIGVLSIIDHRPRKLTATEKRALCSLAGASQGRPRESARVAYGKRRALRDAASRRQ